GEWPCPASFAWIQWNMLPGHAEGGSVSLVVILCRVRGIEGSVSVAECSTDALSQTTTSPTPYFMLCRYFVAVEWAASSRSRSSPSSAGMPSMPKDEPDTE